MIIRDYDELIAALRSRQDEIGLKDSDLELLTGMTPGHVGKIFGPSRPKNLGAHSIFLLLGGLALKWVIEPDLEAAQKMEARWEKRDELRRRPGVIRKRISPELRAKIMRENGHVSGCLAAARLGPDGMAALGAKGGRRAARTMSQKQRKIRAQAAAAARWKRGPNGQGNARHVSRQQRTPAKHHAGDGQDRGEHSEGEADQRRRAIRD